MRYYKKRRYINGGKKMDNALLKLISDHGDSFIICFAVVIFVLLMINGVILSNHKSRIKENLKLDNGLYSINFDTKSIEESENEKIVITPSAIRNFETKFNGACSYHDILAQMIPLFPLLGILGTVAGLMTMVDPSAKDNLQNLYMGMGSALSTTLYGLIAAIILKFTDALFTSRIINDVDVMLDDFDKKLELAKTFK